MWSAFAATAAALAQPFETAHLRALRHRGHPSPDTRAKGGAGDGDRTRLTSFSNLVMARSFW
jgi:hypothetical protein